MYFWISSHDILFAQHKNFALLRLLSPVKAIGRTRRSDGLSTVCGNDDDTKQIGCARFHEATGARQLLSENRLIGDIISRLERALNELWLSEFGWASIEIFAPVYELLCEWIALHGMAFARHGDEWRIVVSES